MNLETFRQKESEITDQITRLQNELNEVKKEYLQTSPFKRGDKVVLTLINGKEVICFISKIDIPYSFQKLGFRYEFNVCKKDGMMGLNSAGVYSYESIEKAE